MTNSNDESPERFSYALAPWETIARRRPSRARILRAMLQYREPLYAYYRNLLVPARPEPTPLGAVLMLWDGWEDARSRCLQCGAYGMLTNFGGLLSVGTMSGLCLGCERVVTRRIGGFGVALQGALQALEGTGYRLPLSFPQGWSLGGKASALVAALQEVGAEGLPNYRRARL